jgi:hypothetical protein
VKRGGPIQRHHRMRAHGKGWFRARRNDPFRKWIATFPCVVDGCDAPTMCCHIERKGQGGYDVGNTFPGCYQHHIIEQHGAGGIPAFEKKHGLDLRQIAAGYAEAWTQHLDRADVLPF